MDLQQADCHLQQLPKPVKDKILRPGIIKDHLSRAPRVSAGSSALPALDMARPTLGDRIRADLLVPSAGLNYLVDHLAKNTLHDQRAKQRLHDRSRFHWPTDDQHRRNRPDPLIVGLTDMAIREMG